MNRKSCFAVLLFIMAGVILPIQGVVGRIGNDDEVLADSLEEAGVIQLDSATFMDMFMPAVEVDTIGRYTVVSEKDKLGVYDTWKKTNVTPTEFDVLYYAQRVESPDGTRVLFIMQLKDDVGTLEVMEDTNEYEVQILAGAPKLKR